MSHWVSKWEEGKGGEGRGGEGRGEDVLHSAKHRSYFRQQNMVVGSLMLSAGHGD